MLVRTMRFTLVISTILLLAGCFHIPKREFSQYKQTFAQVHATAGDILLDFDQALKKAKERQAAQEQGQDAPAVRPPYPADLEAFEAKRGGEKLDDIEVRRRALQVITQYNDLLTQLAEGKSAQEVKSSASGLVNAVGKFVTIAGGSGVPGLSAIATIVSTLAELVEKARTRAEFSRAVREGRPVIEKIIDALIEDRGDHYGLRFGLAQEERLLILDEITIRIRLIRGFVASLGPSRQDGPNVSDAEKDLNSILKPVRGEIVEYPIRLKLAPASARTAPFTEGADERTQASILEIKEQVEKYENNVKQMQALGRALVEYGKLLERTKTALATLEKMLDKPQDISIVAEELARAVFSVKRNLETLRSAVR